MAGQISGMIKDIKPCRVIIDEIINDAERIIKNIYNISGGKHV
jgi:enoyl-[acyl-carrier protein] reductase II